MSVQTLSLDEQIAIAKATVDNLRKNLERIVSNQGFNRTLGGELEASLIAKESELFALSTQKEQQIQTQTEQIRIEEEKVRQSEMQQTQITQVPQTQKKNNLLLPAVIIGGLVLLG